MVVPDTVVPRNRMYLGGYGHQILLATVDPDTGLPVRVRPAAETAEPSYLAYAADRRVLYAVNEVADGSVSAFAVDPDGSDGEGGRETDLAGGDREGGRDGAADGGGEGGGGDKRDGAGLTPPGSGSSHGAGLTPLGSRSSHGAHPCFVHVHPVEPYLLTANYGSGTVAVHPITGTGALAEASDVVRHAGSGPDPDRQEGPHAHQVLTGPGAGFVHAVDLGADAVFTYRLRDGRLHPAGELRVRPGAGPRHLRFHPSGQTAYLAEELSSTLTSCRYDPDSGRLTPVRTVPAAPETGVPNYPSEVVVSPDGRFVYLANRGHNSVAVFGVDGDRLDPLGTRYCGGDWPRHIAFGRDGRHLYVANQRSGDLATFRVAPDGSLDLAGTPTRAGTPAAVLPC